PGVRPRNRVSTAGHGPLRRALPRPARARRLHRAEPVRVPLPVACARRRGDRGDCQRRLRRRRKRRVSVFEEITAAASRESPLWAAAVLPGGLPEQLAVFSTLAPARFELGLENVSEAYL